jgi:hypothetical protein
MRGDDRGSSFLGRWSRGFKIALPRIQGLSNPIYRSKFWVGLSVSGSRNSNNGGRIADCQSDYDRSFGGSR